jgi:hypothetical protein
MKKASKEAFFVGDRTIYRHSRSSSLIEFAGPCGSGFIGAPNRREASDAVPGTGYAGIRGQARSHRDRASFSN